jgi:hypothetical protein
MRDEAKKAMGNRRQGNETLENQGWKIAPCQLRGWSNKNVRDAFLIGSSLIGWLDPYPRLSSPTLLFLFLLRISVTQKSTGYRCSKQNRGVLPYLNVTLQAFFPSRYLVYAMVEAGNPERQIKHTDGSRDYYSVSSGQQYSCNGKLF